MPTGAALLAFLAAATIVVAVPGPSLLFTIGRALSVGRRDALLTVVGNAFGLLGQSALVAVGLGAVLAASSTAYTIVKLLGGGYLVYLGIQAIRHRHALATALQSADAASLDDATGMPPRGTTAMAPTARRSLAQGVLVGITNPKSLVFLSSLLPQFVDRSSAPQPQILLLGAIFALLAMIGDSIWALAAGRARSWFARDPRRLARLGATGGTLMVGLGTSIAVSSRAA